VAKLWPRCGHATGATLSDVRAAEATEAIAVEVFRQRECSGQLVSMTVINRALNQLRAHRPTCKCRLCGEAVAKARADRMYRVAARWQHNATGRPDRAGLDPLRANTRRRRAAAILRRLRARTDRLDESDAQQPSARSTSSVAALAVPRVRSDSNRLQRLPIPADHRHRSVLIHIDGTLQLDPPRRFPAGDNRSSLSPCWIAAQA